jgi:hypothetical protein
MLAVLKERFWVKGPDIFILSVWLYNSTMMPGKGNVTAQEKLIETAILMIWETAAGRLCFC